jgi:DNA-directed RNA polymerase specialized sigma24 family protein
MSRDHPDPRLSQLSALWSLVCRAHQGAEDARGAARQALLERYGGPVRRYLLRCLRGDPDAAAEVFQEFALRFVRGDFHRADPARGRFRDFVKTALFHLVVDHHKRRQAQPRPLTDDDPEPAVGPPGPEELDREFVQGWRDEVLGRAWDGLAEAERQTGRPYHTVLHYRAQHPGATSQAMADALAAGLGRPLTAAGVRQTLHRARDRFADLVLDEVAQTVDEPDTDRLEEELIELGLLDYCRPALERRR